MARIVTAQLHGIRTQLDELNAWVRGSEFSEIQYIKRLLTRIVEYLETEEEKRLKQ